MRHISVIIITMMAWLNTSMVCGNPPIPKFVVLNEFVLPESCKGQIRCSEKPQNYPDDVIEQLYRQNMLPDNRGMSAKFKDPHELGTIGNNNNIRIYPKIETVYSVMDPHNEKIVYILPQSTNYNQTIRTVECSEPGKACNLRAKFPKRSNLESYAEQKYGRILLSALKLEGPKLNILNTTPIKVDISFKSGCVCMYRNKNNQATHVDE